MKVLQTTIASTKPSHDLHQLLVSPSSHNVRSKEPQEGSTHTLSEAIVRARELRASGATCEIVLLAGIHHIRETVELGPEDSGLLIRGEGNNKTVLDGGLLISADAFHAVKDEAVLARLPEEAREQVLCCDLRAQGIDNFGEIHRASSDRPAALEVFVAGRALPLARWPNEGTVPITRTYDTGSVRKVDGYAEVFDTGNRGALFEYDYDRAARWQDAPDIWLDGFFHWGWYWDVLPVARISLHPQLIRLGAAHLYGVRGIYDDNWRATGWEHLRRYFVFNLLEEIDQPGEWYLDRTRGILYLWPPVEFAAQGLAVSVLEQPFFKIEGGSEIRLEGMTFQNSRHNAIHIADGTNMAVRDCIFSMLAGRGVIASGSGHLIEGCDFLDLGFGGVSLSGGDRRTLEPGECEVRNCTFSRYGRRGPSVAIALHGVGQFVRHCHVHDSPHRAIHFRGNNHLIEYNLLERIHTSGDDVGAVGIGRNPSERGTRFRFNEFREIGAEPNCVTSIYLDDGASGVTIENNIFDRASTGGRGAIFMNGGSSNRVAGNLVVDCVPAAVKLSDCYRTWGRQRLATWLRPPDGDWYQRLTHEIDPEHPEWVRQFPEVRDFLKNDPGTPKGHFIGGNVVAGCEVLTVINTPPEDPLSPEPFLQAENPQLEGAEAQIVREALAGRLPWAKAEAVLAARVPDWTPIPRERLGRCHPEAGDR